MGIKQGSESYKVYTEQVGNRSKMEGCYGDKTDHETTTLRAGSLPKPEEVKTVDRDENKGKTVECAAEQNGMHDSSKKPRGEAGPAVLPNTGTLRPPVSSAK